MKIILLSCFVLLLCGCNTNRQNSGFNVLAVKQDVDRLPVHKEGSGTFYGCLVYHTGTDEFGQTVGVACPDMWKNQEVVGWRVKTTPVYTIQAGTNTIVLRGETTTHLETNTTTTVATN